MAILTEGPLMQTSLGPPGRMISGSKTAPKGHVCVFNANVCIKSKGKIWFGDIDITSDAGKLFGLAKELGEVVYILRERGARFQNEHSPLYENAVARFWPDGQWEQFAT